MSNHTTILPRIFPTFSDVTPVAGERQSATINSAFAANKSVDQALATTVPSSPQVANNGSVTTPASSKPGEPSPWTQGGSTGCGCGAKGCGTSQGGASQGTQSQDTAQRPQDSVSKQDSSGSGDLPPAPPPSIFN